MDSYGRDLLSTGGSFTFRSFSDDFMGQNNEHDPPGGNDRPFGRPNYEQPKEQNVIIPSRQDYVLVGGYVGENLDNLISSGVQQLLQFIVGGDVSSQTSANIEFAANLAIIIVSKGKNVNANKEVVKTVVRSETKAVSSRAARREVMRREGIPTSQQPHSQSKNSSGREYMYETTKPGGGTQMKSVQQQTLDSSHINQPHWEAGTVKSDNGTIFMNRYGRPKLSNKKSKVDY